MMKKLCLLAVTILWSLSATAQVSRVNLTSEGAQFTGASLEPRLSADGRILMFQNFGGWAIKNLSTQSLLFGPLMTGPLERREFKLSGNGRFAVFTTRTAHDPGDTNGSTDLYLQDLQTQVLSRVSANGENPRYPTIDDAGEVIAYFCGSFTDRKTCVFRRSAAERTVLPLGLLPPSVSGNGEFLFVTDDTGSFRISLETGTSIPVAVESDGTQVYLGELSVSADGSRLVAGGSRGDGQGRNWIWDADVGHIVEMLPYPELCSPSISRDGRWAAFNAKFNFWGGHNSIGQQSYLMNLDTGTVQWISRPPTGESANNGGGQGPFTALFDPCFRSGGPQPNADGSVIAFSSWASNLVPDDTNTASDIFILRRGTPPPQVSIPIPVFNGLAATGLLLGVGGWGLWATRGRLRA